MWEIGYPLKLITHLDAKVRLHRALMFLRNYNRNVYFHDRPHLPSLFLAPGMIVSYTEPLWATAPKSCERRRAK
jgi:hypothetical protein